MVSRNLPASVVKHYKKLSCNILAINTTLNKDILRSPVTSLPRGSSYLN